MANVNSVTENYFYLIWSGSISLMLIRKTVPRRPNLECVEFSSYDFRLVLSSFLKLLKLCWRALMKNREMRFQTLILLSCNTFQILRFCQNGLKFYISVLVSWLFEYRVKCIDIMQYKIYIHILFSKFFFRYWFIYVWNYWSWSFRCNPFVYHNDILLLSDNQKP